ncbi:MAG: alpha/beta hydrolase [Pseudomonadales bacterium]|nr:alpha/beta hydrolase [Pseudomonadales bacterium]
MTTMFANTAAAQLPQLAVANASVIDPVTAESSIQSTTAEFYAGASIDEGVSYVSCVDPLDSVDLESSLAVENDHVGSAGNIYVLAIVGEESYMLVGDVFLPWDGLRDSLEPFATKDLAGTETISVLDQVQFESAGIDQGELAIYIGYELISDTDKIYYSATPLRVDIVPGALGSRSRYVGVDSCSPYAVDATSAIVYGTGTVTNPATAEVDLLLDLYMPDVNLFGKKVPAMVIIHGGAFYAGSRSQPALVDYAARFAAQGYLSISIDYRLAGQVPELSPQFASLYDQVESEDGQEQEQGLGMIAAMEDSLKAIAWLKNYAQGQGFEISALGLLGGSAGAVTALNVGYGLDDYGFSVPEFKVVVNHWGNLAIDTDSSKPSITADEAALISVHGTEDPTVLYSGSVDIHARADEIGLTNELITSEGAAHGFSENRLWGSESFEGSGYTKGERVLNFVNASMLTPSGPPEEVYPDQYNVLYIGHSFGRTFAEKLETFARDTGFEDHASYIEMSGGASGAPDALWADDGHRENIKAYLDTGEIDVLIMICCSVEFVETGGESDEAIWNFASYALAKNPATRIGLSWLWKDFPQDYASAEEHRDGADESYALWVNLANDLNADYPDADVFTINHAEVVYDLRAAYEAGELGGDAAQLTGPSRNSVFTDEKGHAGNITKDTGTLIWLHAVHGVEPNDAPAFPQWETDIRAIAQAALDNAAQL